VCPSTRAGSAPGYFDDIEKLVDQAVILSGGTAKNGTAIPAVYVMLNPVNEALLARCHNRVEDFAKHTASDEDIVRRHLLPFDADPRRPTGIMATPAERELAIGRAREVMSYLGDQGFPPGLLADSGNGGHGLHGLDLPTTDEVADPISRFLHHLHRRFSDDKVGMDTMVYNALRVWKVYGTRVQKGDEVGERRHRLARLVEVPDVLEPVERGLIEKVVEQDRNPAFSLPGKDTSDEPPESDTFDRHVRLAEAVLASGGIGVAREKDRQGGVLWVLDRCPFCGNTDRCAHVEVKADGRLCFACKHDTCKRPDGGRHGWMDLRDRYDPSRSLALEAEGRETEAADGRPRIVTNRGQLRDMTEQAVSAVLAYNRQPRLFCHGGVAVRVEDGGEAPVRDLRHDDYLDILSSAADWKAARGSRSGSRLEDVPPPPAVVATTRSRLTARLPELRGVVHAPVLTPGGGLLLEPGYDAASGLWHAAGGLEVPAVPDRPGEHDIAGARALLLDDLLGDFPFVDEASRAHALAALLLPFVRPLIDGPTPLHLIDAPAEGTGKGLLADAVAVPALGRPAAKMLQAAGDAEWAKTLLAKLRSSPPVVVIDNVRQALDSPSLASVLTAHPCWESRLLGSSTMQAVPVLCTWMATGNNVHASKEIIRRIVRVRMDARMEHPNERRGFRHPNLSGWARQNRPILVAAALTLCRAWLAAGAPAGEVSLGSFESWASVVGGILEVAGVPGFLGNVRELREEVNPADARWRDFVAAWGREFGTRTVGVSDLFGVLVRHQLALLDEVMDRARGKAEHSQRIQLGLIVANRLHQCVGGWRVESAGEGRNGRLYRLACVVDGEGEEAVGPVRAAGLRDLGRLKVEMRRLKGRATLAASCN
jgi:hypothetical protein